MIIRIVKMTFSSDRVPGFLAIFEARKHLIRNFPGCSHLQLLQDADNPEIYFTYSHWEAPTALEAYRRSEFFKETWTLTKACFSMPAEAWSLMTTSNAD